MSQSLVDKIPIIPKSFLLYMPQPLSQSFALILLTPTEIMNLTHCIHTAHSKGVNGIDPVIALLSLRKLASLLPEIIYCSFITEIFVSAQKTAKVVPIHKKGPREEVSNLRPNLSCLILKKYMKR